MSELPVRKRPYKFFVSYSHKDYTSVAELVHWLDGVAGLKVWWDDRRLPVGSMIPSALPNAIKQSQAAIFFISQDSARSGWVREEYGAALLQRTKSNDYRIITIKTDDAPIPDFLQTTKWVEMAGGKLDAQVAIGLLNALYPSNAANPASGSHDVYISRSWRANESATADAACVYFCKAGFRLVGDSEDQKMFDPNNRVRSIMSSCGAVIALVPDRGNGQTSPFIITEIRLAAELGLPYLLITDDNVLIDPELVDNALERQVFSLAELASNEELGSSLVDILWEGYKQPISPHYVFYGASLRQENGISEYVCNAVEIVTGLECIMGQNLYGQHAQREIITRITNALFMLADISGDNKNTIIEAGIARGVGTPVMLLDTGEPRPTLFMFRDLEVNFYKDSVDLLGIVHRIVYPYRRRILNSELIEV